MGDEGVRRQGVAPQVAACEACAANEQLADHPRRHGLQVAIEYIALRIGDRLADRNDTRGADLMPGISPCQAGVDGRLAERPIAVRGVDGRFRRPIEIAQPHARQSPLEFAREAQVKCFATANQFAQGASAEQRLGKQSAQCRGHHLQNRDALVDQQPRQRRHIALLAWGREHQSCATLQRHEELDECSVEADRGELHKAIRFAALQSALQPLHVVDPATMLKHHALGLAGGAGGVDDAGELVRNGGFVQVILRPVAAGATWSVQANDGVHRRGGRRGDAVDATRQRQQHRC